MKEKNRIRPLHLSLQHRKWLFFPTPHYCGDISENGRRR